MAAVSAVLAAVGVLGIAMDGAQQPDGQVISAAGARPVTGSSPLASDVRPQPVATASSADSTEAVSDQPVEVLLPVPTGVRIPAIGVAAPVVPVGLQRDGAIEIPDDVDVVGWYELGVPPGADRGSAVLVAHRDGRGQGRGVFYDLGHLDVGDRLTVRTTADGTLGFRVVARESIRKKRLPYEELFAADGPPRLTLISCGGVYDPDRGGYQDNVVVTAVPETPPAGDRGAPPAGDRA